MEKLLRLILPVNLLDIRVLTQLTNPYEQIPAGFLLIVLSPLMLIIIILVKMSSKGDILFIQEREGKNGKVFKIWKFRTMFEGQSANLSNSDENREHEKRRITPLGKLLRKSCLDEIPQVINIMNGDMSFVGPRPLIREHSCPSINPNYAPRAKSILPGLTGWEQTSPKRDVKGYHTHHYDWWYATRKCMLLDLYILLWRTPLYIVSAKKLN